MKRFLLFLSIVGIASCSAKKDFSKITKGMTEAQVTAVVGEPAQKLSVVSNIAHWKYNDKDQHIIVFEDDTVANVTDAKGAQEAMDAFKAGMDSMSKITDSSTQK